MTVRSRPIARSRVAFISFDTEISAFLWTRLSVRRIWSRTDAVAGCKSRRWNELHSAWSSYARLLPVGLCVKLLGRWSDNYSGRITRWVAIILRIATWDARRALPSRPLCNQTAAVPSQNEDFRGPEAARRVTSRPRIEDSSPWLSS